MTVPVAGVGDIFLSRLDTLCYLEREAGPPMHRRTTGVRGGRASVVDERSILGTYNRLSLA